MSDSLLDALAKPPPPPSELDELFNRMREDPSLCTADDIDKVIQFQRQARARREAGGGKAKRATKDSPDSGIDLVALVTRKQPAAPAGSPSPKPTGSGFRRI